MAAISLLYKTDAICESRAILWGAATGCISTMEMALQSGANVDAVGPEPSKVLQSIHNGDPLEITSYHTASPCTGVALHFVARNDQLSR